MGLLQKHPRAGVRVENTSITDLTPVQQKEGQIGGGPPG